ncbi:peptide ABC transporter substrate-binding protein [Porticoccus sp. W117]|uniref:peptide ABC transporter substrate-binding protein n=1 Tax=Porticoccus sp. W117 TaxID=3054777 RepID=UPI002595976D|nr:peptide ABC transporter substrate-binding protein [Porticoccus sp. W117]MDM3871042.1 peptide ABC transporter substrate-binding protein [Porticoccus sp. W117]
MRKQRISFCQLVAVLCSLSLLTACSSDKETVSEAAVEAVSKKHLTIGMTQYPESLHRSFARQTSADYVLSLMLRRSVYYDDQAKLQCNTCVNIPTLENGKARIVEKENGERGIVVNFQIKPGLNWGDGSPVTTEDFKLRWEIGRHPDVGANRLSWFENIERFEILDDKNFALHYREATNEYNYIRALAPINSRLERTIFEENPANYRDRSLYKTEPTNPALWNGPYLLKSLTPGAKFVVTRNPHWHGQRPQFDEITIKIIENTSALEANLLSGAIDMIGFGLQSDQGFSFEKRHGRNYQVVYSENAVFSFMTVNMDNPILADKRVRKAILFALNREEANQQLFSGRQQIMRGFNPDRPIEGITQYPFNPGKAIELLEEAGWQILKKGIRHNDKDDPLQFELVSVSGNKSRELLQQWMQGQLKNVGIDLRIRNQTARVFFGETRKKRLFSGMTLQSNPSQPYINWRRVMHSSAIPTPENKFSGFNRAGYRSDEMDQITDVLDRALTQEERQQVDAAIQKLVMEELIVITLFWKPRVHVVPLGLSGVNTSRYDAVNTNWVEEWRW